MKYKYTYGGALIGDEEKKAIMKVVDRNWWPWGEEGLKFEQEAAKYLGVKYALGANSGSSAGLLALAALELPKGSEVIIPAVTFPTIFNIIVQLGLTPVVVDAKIGTYNLEPNDILKAISPKTKAVICVHAVGNPCDMPRIMKIAKKHNLYVIEDNCDGWGGTIGNRKVGSFGHLSFTSFHAAHIVAMGQGGGVFTNDKELARKVRMYRDWGRQSDIQGRTNNNKWKTLPKDQDSRFIYEKLGWNLSPLELQAAMGRVQLKKTEMIKRRRMANFKYLYKELSKFPDLIMPKWVEGAEPSWFSFPISVKGKRAPLLETLENNGIETRSLFAGNILKHPGYLNVPHRVGTDLDEANWILEHSFWITCHPRYTPKDLKGVVKVFADYFKHAKAS